MKKIKNLNNFQICKVKGGVDPISAFAIMTAFFSAALVLEDIIRSKHESFHRRQLLNHKNNQMLCYNITR